MYCTHTHHKFHHVTMTTQMALLRNMTSDQFQLTIVSIVFRLNRHYHHLSYKQIIWLQLCRFFFIQIGLLEKSAVLCIFRHSFIYTAKSYCDLRHWLCPFAQYNCNLSHLFSFFWCAWCFKWKSAFSSIAFDDWKSVTILLAVISALSLPKYLNCANTIDANVIKIIKTDCALLCGATKGAKNNSTFDVCIDKVIRVFEL